MWIGALVCRPKQAERLAKFKRGEHGVRELDNSRVGASGPGEKGSLVDGIVRNGDRAGVGADSSWVADVVGFYHPADCRSRAEGEGGVVDYGVSAVEAGPVEGDVGVCNRGCEPRKVAVAVLGVLWSYVE